MLLLVDIGAKGGIHNRWKKQIPGFYAILFEPDVDSYNQLKEISSENIVVINQALSNNSGEMKFYHCVSSDLSSVYKPNHSVVKRFVDFPLFGVVREERISVDTLENQLIKNGFDEIDFVKIDVQGHELAILNGGGKFIEQLIGIETEIEFVEFYEGQPLFEDVNKFMIAHGFELYDLQRSFSQISKDKKINKGRKGQLVCGNALYFRSPENVVKLFQNDFNKLKNAVYVYSIYGYIDLANNLINSAIDVGLFSNSDINEMHKTVKTFDKKMVLPDFKGKLFINKIGEFIFNISVPKNRFQPDSKLGN